MSHPLPLLPRLRALALLVIAVLLLPTAAAAAPGELATDDDGHHNVRLPAPFACGTRWAGSTYPGHGSNNWNLDLNRAGDAGGSSDLGQPLFAQANGTVVWFSQTGYNSGAGTYVEIDYGEVTVRYLHLVSGSIPAEIAEIGARVKAGQLFGLLGATGRVSGPHLHLEYWDSGGFDDTAWYQLPGQNHLPVAFDGQPMVATPNTPTDATVSTNCTDDALGQGRRLRANSQLDRVL